MQAQLEVSVRAAAAKEAEAAAAAKAEQAALQAAERARQQSCAAVAAATGAQPHVSCPGFWPQQQQQPMQLSKQQVRQEFAGQKLLNSVAAAGPVCSPTGRPDNGRNTASGIAVTPSRDCSPTYACRMRDMQDHIDALTRSLTETRVSPKRLRGQKGHKYGGKNRQYADVHSKKRRPSQPPVQQSARQMDVSDLVDSEDESAEEADSSSDLSRDDDASSSDRSALVISTAVVTVSKVL